MAPSVARESTLHCKPDSQLHSAAVRRMLSVGPEVDNGNSGSLQLPRIPPWLPSGWECRGRASFQSVRTSFPLLCSRFGDRYLPTLFCSRRLGKCDNSNVASRLPDNDSDHERDAAPPRRTRFTFC
jgi:hypothetical protein